MPSEVEAAMAQALRAQQLYRPKDLIEGRKNVQSVGLVKEVSRRTVTPKNGTPPFILFDIEDSNGIKWTTKRDDIALTAHALVGKTATFEGTIRENGRFKDYFLNSISEANGATPAPQTASVIPDSTPTPTIQTPQIPDVTLEKEMMIWRQVATKVAAQMSEGPGEFWQNVETLIAFYATGNHPGDAYVETAPQPAQDASYDDIPF